MMMRLIAITSLLSLFLLVPFLYSGQDNPNPGGSLVIIGGALQADNEKIYQKFIDLGGGKDNMGEGVME